MPERFFVELVGQQLVDAEEGGTRFKTTANGSTGAKAHSARGRCSVRETRPRLPSSLVRRPRVAFLWGVWCLLYETTGFPGLNYLAFGFVSLPVGVALFIAGLLSYSRARAERRATGDAVAVMFISVAIAIVPLVALVEFADYS